MPRLLIPRKRDRVTFTVPAEHARAGQTIEGFVERRLKGGVVIVVETSGFKRGTPQPGQLRSFVVEETRWTVPPTIAVVVVHRPMTITPKVRAALKREATR